MRQLCLQESYLISGGENSIEHGPFNNLDVALITAGFIAPLLINKITFPIQGGTATAIAFDNFLWSPLAAIGGLVLSKILHNAVSYDINSLWNN